ncbi:MAG: minor capsid protein [Selenomonadaceae bacterium]|nr:minor capsid protein [Selenomonadaceae bacterium]
MNEFIAVLDNRTSKTRQSRDGEVYPMSEKSVGFNYPPLHPRCRSTVAPYIEDSGRLGSRIAKVNSRRLHVPESMRYEEFKAKYLTRTRLMIF